MVPWSRLRALRAADRRLLAESGLRLVAARLGLWVVPSFTLRRALDGGDPARREPDPALPERVAWAVGALSRRLPGMTCLVQSLAAHALLRRHGHRPALHIGVREGGNEPQLDAHAWVECEGRVVAGEIDRLPDYRVLTPAGPRAPSAPGALVTQAVAAPLADGLAAVLRGERCPWLTLGVEPADLLAACAEEDLTGLIHRGIARAADCDWPRELRDGLARAARTAAIEELLRRKEVVAVLDALAQHGVRPILLKGTPLAYTVYEEPSLRPRSDTDLFIAREQRDAVRRVMTEIGYAATNFSDGEILFCQFEFAREDGFGVGHAFDFHWKISTQAAFADLLGYDELAAEATAVPPLGAHARAAGAVHALLLACIHPVMHHRNWERLIWLYDIHQLTGRLPPSALERFAELAVRKGVAAVCGRQLALAGSRLGTAVPPGVLAALGATDRATEPSASYLVPGRRWRDELVSNVRDLGRWTDRLRLLREVAFPSSAYVLRAYGLEGVAAGRALLPALYLHRGMRGLWKVVRGRK